MKAPIRDTVMPCILNSSIVSVLFISLITLFSPFSVLAIDGGELGSSEECIVPGEHDAVTFLLVDRSDELEDTENLKRSLLALQKMIQPSERLIVGVSTDKVSDTRIVIDVVRPKQSLWVSKLKIRAAEKVFSDCFHQMESRLLQQDESYKSSAIMETLSFVSKAIRSDRAKTRRVVIYSDMMQNSSSVSFYNSKTLEPESVMKQVEKEYLVSKLPGTEVYVAGVGTGIDDKKARALERFWEVYFDKSGAILKYFGPVLLVS